MPEKEWVWRDRWGWVEREVVPDDDAQDDETPEPQPLAPQCVA
jgi:hypothetical protein